MRGWCCFVMSRPTTHALFGKKWFDFILVAFLYGKKKNNNAQNRITADIPCYSWLKMGKGPVILIVSSLMVCCNTVSLKSSISGNPFQQGNEFSLKFNIFSKNNCVCRKPYLIFKNRIHISYIEDCAITKPFGLSKFISRIIFLFQRLFIPLRLSMQFFFLL